MSKLHHFQAPMQQNPFCENLSLMFNVHVTKKGTAFLMRTIFWNGSLSPSAFSPPYSSLSTYYFYIVFGPFHLLTFMQMTLSICKFLLQSQNLGKLNLHEKYGNWGCQMTRANSSVFAEGPLNSKS